MTWIETALKWLPLVVLILQGGVGWLLWSMRTSFVSNKDCQDCRKEINASLCGLAQADAVAEAVAEAERETLPTAHDLAEFKSSLEAVRGDIRTLEAKVDGQGELLKRIERPVQLLMDYHMRGDK